MPDDLRSGGGLTRFETVANRLLGERGSGDTLGRLKLEGLWPEIVGQVLAEQSAPESVVGGKLTIVVPSPTWNATLRTMERRILQAVQTRCPELRVTSLRITLGRPPARRPSEPPADRPTPEELDAVHLTAGQRTRIDEILATVEDPELRACMARAMSRQAQLHQWRLVHGWRLDPATGEMQPPRRD